MKRRRSATRVLAAVRRMSAVIMQIILFLILSLVENSCQENAISNGLMKRVEYAGAFSGTPRCPLAECLTLRKIS